MQTRRSLGALLLGLAIGAAACSNTKPSGSSNRGKSPPVKPSTPANGSAGTRAGPVPSPKPPKLAPPKTSEAAPKGMVRIPGGFFWMGSHKGENNPEEWPRHEVAVASFLLDRSETTMAEYGECVAAGKCKESFNTHPFCNRRYPDRTNHPVNCIDYTMAAAYCEYRGKRLPTEREWEYAARGGNEQRYFSWGKEAANEKNACYHHPGSCPVNSFKPGAYGLYDVNGNVWEWTSSYFAPYPKEAASGKLRVYRGGSWSRRFPKWLTNAMRNRYPEHKWSASLGVRCARDLAKSTCPPQSKPGPGNTCERSEGAPKCSPGEERVKGECRGAATEYASLATPMATPNGAAGSADKGDKRAKFASATISRMRTPAFDGDCKRNWPSKPAAYRFAGKTFHARAPVIIAAGCQKRDAERHWTSACCRQ